MYRDQTETNETNQEQQEQEATESSNRIASNIEITLKEVVRTMEELKDSKAPGMNDISNEMLKCEEAIAKETTKSFKKE